MRRAALALGLALAAPAGGCGDRQPPSPRRELASDVELCKSRLRAIHAGLVRARSLAGKLDASGPDLLGLVLVSGAWEDTPENRRKLACPGEGVPPRDEPPDPFDGLDRSETAYAARDQERFPLPSFPAPGTEILAACADPANHAEVTNLLYADGSVLTVRDDDLGAERFAEDLAKLR